MILVEKAQITRKDETRIQHLIDNFPYKFLLNINNRMALYDNNKGIGIAKQRKQISSLVFRQGLLYSALKQRGIHISQFISVFYELIGKLESKDIIRKKIKLKFLPKYINEYNLNQKYPKVRYKEIILEVICFNLKALETELTKSQKEILSLLKEIEGRKPIKQEQIDNWIGQILDEVEND